MAEHHVQFLLRTFDFAVHGEVACFAAEDAPCRTVCYRPECEEGCVGDLLALPHPRERVDYCNVKTWLETADDGLVGTYCGPPTSPRSGAIRPVWEGDGYSWCYLRGAGSVPRG